LEGDEEPGVIPLQFLGVEDVDVSQLSSNEVLLHALANLGKENEEGEGGYAVRYGKVPVFDLPILEGDRCSTVFSSKFDALAVAFPLLWPYGEGRWDVDDRPEKLSD
jgi:hypothetical protein